MPIRPLPPLLVNQIAAGEVIERPASVVKELVENSIDAGATRIQITIENGGRDLIEVIDNGDGIPSDELPLALAAHATSKIRVSEDLNEIATMGFRGEAMASIASVSRLTLLSRPLAQVEAWRIDAEGADIAAPHPAGGPVGTRVSVRNLFFNTPARRKFLKTDPTEAGKVNDMVQALALPHPSIAFTLRSGARTVFDVPARPTARDRAIDVIGADLAGELLEFSAEEDDIRLWGLAGRPSIARGTSKHQRVYLNGRPITDRSIAHAIKEAYRGLIEPTRSPTIVMFIEINPRLVDVNVHPAKAEVRFRDQAQIHRIVRRAVQGALREGDLTPALEVARGGPTLSSTAFGSGLPSDPAGTNGRQQFVEYFNRLDPKQKGFVYTEVKQALAHEAPELLEAEPVADAAGVTTIPGVRAVAEALQVHSSYIVTQDEQGLIIIDQHALHERVMFEKLMAQVTSGTLESQRLLMPVVIDVEADQVEALAALRPMLLRIGIESDQMSPTSIAVHAFSSLLFERSVDPVVFMKDLLERAVREGLNHDPEAALHETLDMMACKAAIKAGDRLTSQEMTELLSSRERIERASNCPHGRPTSLRLTIRDLEKQFGRG